MYLFLVQPTSTSSTQVALTGTQAQESQLEEARNLNMKYSERISRFYEEMAKLTSEKDAAVSAFLALQNEKEIEAIDFLMMKIEKERLEKRLNVTSSGPMTSEEPVNKRSDLFIKKLQRDLSAANDKYQEVNQRAIVEEREKWQQSEKIKILEKQLDISRRESSEKDRKVGELTVENEALFSELSAMEKKLRAIEVDLQKDCEVINGAQKWVDAARIHLQRQEEYVNKLETDNNALRNENVDLRDKKCELAAEKEKLETDNKSMRMENEKLRAELKILTKSRNDMWEALSVEKENDDGVEKCLVGALTERLEKDADTVKDLNAKIEKMMVKEQEALKDAAEMKELRLKVEKMSEMEKQARDASEVINRLRSQLMNKEELEKKSERDSETIKRLENQAEESLKLQKTRRDYVSLEKAGYEQKLQTEERKSRKLEQELQTARGSLEKLTVQKAELEEKMEKATSIITTLEDDLRLKSELLANIPIKLTMNQGVQTTVEEGSCRKSSLSDASSLQKAVEEQREINSKLEKDNLKMQLDSESFYDERSRHHQEVMSLKNKNNWLNLQRIGAVDQYRDEKKRWEAEKQGLLKQIEEARRGTRSLVAEENARHLLKRRRTDGSGMLFKVQCQFKSFCSRPLGPVNLHFSTF